MKALFDTKGNWYKGNTHMHTTNSDGALDPEVAISKYKKAGYDFLAITDHWFQGATKEVSAPGDMLILSGVEIDVGNQVTTPIYHILGIGMEKDIDEAVIDKRDRSRSAQEMVDVIKEAGGLAILAHPTWSVTDPWQANTIKGLDGVEIYNVVSNVDFHNANRADASIYFDLWAKKGIFYNAYVGDDSHWYIGEHCNTYMMVNAKKLDSKHIKRSLLDGNFYCSQGPEFISVKYDEKKIEVECRGAKRAVFVSGSIWNDNRVINVPESGRVSYTPNSLDTYIRIELYDEDGRRAWTSPFDFRK